MDKRNPFDIQTAEPSGETFIGAYLPVELAGYMRLLAVYYNTTVTSLIIEMLEKRYSAEGEEETQDHIIRNLAQRAYAEWMRRLKQRKKRSGWQTDAQIVSKFREYEDEMRKVLIKRKVTEPIITEVIQVMENLYGIR